MVRDATEAKVAKEEMVQRKLDRKRALQKEENAPRLAMAMEDVSKAMVKQAEVRDSVKGAMAAGLRAMQKKKKQKTVKGSARSAAAFGGVPL